MWTEFAEVRAKKSMAEKDVAEEEEYDDEQEEEEETGDEVQEMEECRHIGIPHTNPL